MEKDADVVEILAQNKRVFASRDVVHSANTQIFRLRDAAAGVLFQGFAHILPFRWNRAADMR